MPCPSSLHSGLFLLQNVLYESQITRWPFPISIRVPGHVLGLAHLCSYSVTLVRLLGSTAALDWELCYMNYIKSCSPWFFWFYFLEHGLMWMWERGMEAPHLLPLFLCLVLPFFFSCLGKSPRPDKLFSFDWIFHLVSKHHILLGFYVDFSCLDGLVEQMCKSLLDNGASSLSLQVMKPLLHSELY